ncbi:MAG: hypothetical protein KY475_02245, partial [Planctomycetes bacterium]|nr:hypothetical protein [Planctomycetota bacterium]
MDVDHRPALPRRSLRFFKRLVQKETWTKESRLPVLRQTGLWRLQQVHNALGEALLAQDDVEVAGGG